MKKIFFGFGLLVLSVFALPQASFATSGACSYHGGVNCSAGADYDGSVICNDGWRDSSVSYSSMAMCRSYGYSYSTPSCPLMSSYDSFSGSCKCFAGYSVQKDIIGNDACVSNDTICSDRLGSGGQYDSLHDSCKCRYGYVFDGKKCATESSYCMAKIGLMSQYDSLTDSCKCMSGYELKGGTCIYKSSSSSYSGTSAPSYSYASSCPANSHDSPTDSTKCLCDSGYQVSPTKDSCVPVPLSCPDNALPVGQVCACKNGYSWNAGKTACVSPVPDAPAPVVAPAVQESKPAAPMSAPKKATPAKSAALAPKTATAATVQSQPAVVSAPQAKQKTKLGKLLSSIFGKSTK